MEDPSSITFTTIILVSSALGIAFLDRYGIEKGFYGILYLRGMVLYSMLLFLHRRVQTICRGSSHPLGPNDLLVVTLAPAISMIILLPFVLWVVLWDSIPAKVFGVLVGGWTYLTTVERLLGGDLNPIEAVINGPKVAFLRLIGADRSSTFSRREMIGWTISSTFLALIAGLFAVVTIGGLGRLLPELSIVLGVFVALILPTALALSVWSSWVAISLAWRDSVAEELEATSSRIELEGSQSKPGFSLKTE